MVTFGRSIPSSVRHAPCAMRSACCALLFALCAMLHAPCASADPVPVKSWLVNAEQAALQDIGIRRGGTWDLRPTFRNYGTPLVLSNVTSVVLQYKPLGSSTLFATTGSVHSITGGVANVRWSPACESTNNTYTGDINLLCATSTVVCCPVRILLTPDTSYNATTSAPTARDSINWQTVVNYNPASGPFPYFLGTPVAGQTLSYNGTNWYPSSAGSGDMLAVIYDPAGRSAPMAFAGDNTAWGSVTGTPTTVSGYGITNTASLAQGIAGTNAQARVGILETNTASLAQGIAGTNAQARVGILETNTASLAQGIAGTNAQAVATGHVARVDNPHSVTPAQIGAVSNTPEGIAAAGGVTNGGATINGSPITNGAAITVTGTGLTSAQVSTITTYTTTNPTFAFYEGTNTIAWIPNESNALSCSFTSPGAGKSLAGMLRLVHTNATTITWPTNAVWYSNGTRTTNVQPLSVYNRIVVDWWDGMLTLGVVSTNGTSL
jgi:hypothetical protein